MKIEYWFGLNLRRERMGIDVFLFINVGLGFFVKRNSEIVWRVW